MIDQIAEAITKIAEEKSHKLRDAATGVATGAGALMGLAAADAIREHIHNYNLNSPRFNLMPGFTRIGMRGLSGLGTITGAAAAHSLAKRNKKD